MVFESLYIRNIGPFEAADIHFASDFEKTPVTVITGRNGTGKSIVLDAIRAVLVGGNALERDIVTTGKSSFAINLGVRDLNGNTRRLKTEALSHGFIREGAFDLWHPLVAGYKTGDKVLPFVIDYWSSKSSKGKYEIQTLGKIDNQNFLAGALSGVKNNVDLINFICHIDYLKSSEDKAERATGEYVYGVIKEIIDCCIDNGKFLHVRRSDYQPIILQNGHELTFSQLSSGNIFLIERLILLICKFYSLSVLLNIPIQEAIDNTEGVLLIDEIETHLHPKWQKSILNIIRRFFPKMQIILTTHSPFILSSLSDLRIYTAKVEDGKNVITDETDIYSGMPVDDILLSDAFETTPFSNDITLKMRSRKEAIRKGNNDEVKKLTEELIRINPSYFGYMGFNNGIGAQ